MDTELAIKITADGKDASAAADQVADSFTEMASQIDAASDKADAATSKLDGVAGAADNVDSKMGAAAGSLGALSGGLEAAGFPGAAAGLQGIATAADAASGAGGILNLVLESQAVVTVKAKVAAVGKAVADKAMAAASKAAAAAQWVLNAAMSANPIGLVVAAVALLVAGFILAYKKSETFRDIVQGAMGVAKAAVGKVIDVVKDIKDKIGEVASKLPSMSDAFSVAKTLIVGYIDLVTAPIRILLGIIKDVVDWIGKIDFPEPPGWLKTITGQGRSATGGGLTGSMSADLRNGTGGGGITLVNVQLQTLDLRGTAVRDLVQALRREGISVGTPVRNS